MTLFDLGFKFKLRFAFLTIHKGAKHFRRKSRLAKFARDLLYHSKPQKKNLDALAVRLGGCYRQTTAFARELHGEDSPGTILMQSAALLEINGSGFNFFLIQTPAAFF